MPSNGTLASGTSTMRYALSSPPTRLRPLTLFVAVLLVGFSLSAGSGCTQLRLPQIDPTGACLFAPYPENSTQINPSCGCLNCLSGNGEGCLSRLAGQPRSCLNCLTSGGCKCGLGGCFKSMLPEPAFPEPATPPPCAPLPGATGQPSICLPAPGCEACADGPPAVLLGCEADIANLAKLPNRGKRGCILLSPQRIVAPVGGEVLLLSGVCGNDGYLMQREPLEWMLTPESVGHIIDVGDDDPGLVHRLAHTPKVDKRSGSYARGVTSTKVSLITRGNKNVRDDVRLEKGQTWISLSSPTEGTSRVTVLAPESECWDQRKATATIYWIDARWQFPGPKLAEKGTPVVLSTRVTRSEGAIPARGWIVRYEILNPELATFYSSGTAVDEVVVGEDGNAAIQVVPNPGTSGTAAVAMTVIRPAGESDNMPRMTLGQGRTTVTWSAAQLRVRAGAPQVAGYEQPFTVACEVANPGNLDAKNVRVTMELRPGMTVQSIDSFARQLGNEIVWEIDSIPSQQQWEIQATFTSKAPVMLQFQARASEQNLFAEDSVQVDIYRPSLSLGIQPVISSGDRAQVGDEVTFNIDITNTGERALENLKLESLGDPSMIHAQTGVPQAFKDKQDGLLQPGETWKVATTYIPTTPGQRCLTVTATADGGQTASDQSCITVINPIPATPAMAVRIEGRPTMLEGDDSVYFRYRVTNTGREPLSNVRVTTAYPPSLDVLEATQDGFDASELSQYKLNWLVAQIAPGQQAVFEARFRALQSLASGLIVLSVASENGASASDQYRFDIYPAAVQPPRSTPVPPNLPPVQPSPSIPNAGNPAAQPSTAPPPLSPSDRGAAPPIAADTGSLRLRLVGLDNPAEVGGAMRFQLVVSNERDIPDSQVQLSFQLPGGTRIERITQTMNPGGEQIRESGGVIYLSEIRQLTPRESITYTIVLNSNQPQQIRFEVQATSRLSPAGIAAVESVTVLPR